MRLVPETRLRYELSHSRDIPSRLLVSGSPYLHSTVYKATWNHGFDSQIWDITATEPERRNSLDDNRLTCPSQYTTPYHAAVFVEPRLETAQPSQWTAVCKDDTLLRKLLAAYFTHMYHLFPAFHKDYFLEDIAVAQTEQQRTPCCSALLVNATLAYACVSQP
jgi:hypothetical protein